jgi:transcription termination factor NusB
MPNKITTKTNETQGHEHQSPYVKCTGRTTHTVLFSVDIHGDESDYDYYWIARHQIVQCLGCKSVSFRTATSNSEDLEPDDDQEHLVESVNESLFPPRREGLSDLGHDLHYLPLSVQRIYKETLMAMSNQAPVLAAIGLRALVETVCKEKDAIGDNLSKQIDNLVSINVLTPTGAAILHKIRTLGNAAAHEVKPHNDKQLGLAMDIVQHLLKDVYILPRQVDLEFRD